LSVPAVGVVQMQEARQKKNKSKRKISRMLPPTLYSGHYY
jgi:hypothetical protein